MKFILIPMTKGYADEVVSWRYDGIYAFYNLDQDREDLEEFLNCYGQADKYYAVLNELNDLAGFFSFSQKDETIVVGLGMKPEYTGMGLGLEFVLAGLEFAKEKYTPSMFSLIVAIFNKRAIKVYEKAGFKPGKVFMHETNGGEYEYLQMIREA